MRRASLPPDALDPAIRARRAAEDSAVAILHREEAGKSTSGAAQAALAETWTQGIWARSGRAHARNVGVFSALGRLRMRSAHCKSDTHAPQVVP